MNSSTFYSLTTVIDDHRLHGAKIYHVEQAGISAIHRPAKIIAKKGVHRPGAITSRERRINITVVCCCNTAGQYIPPMVLFTRKRMLDALKEDAPSGSLVMCSQLGWMDQPTFLQRMRQFVENVKPSRNNPVLLITDGHSSQARNTKATGLAWDSGVVMISLLSHSTLRTQPLDVAFFNPNFSQMLLVRQKLERNSMTSWIHVHSHSVSR